MLVPHKLNQTGDTIIEVMIAIAIISLVLVGAYISTNSNIANMQDAQERSQVVKYLQSQLEDLRVNASAVQTGGCFGQNDQPQDGTGSSCDITPNGGPGTQPDYKISIIPPVGSASPTAYTVQATWASLVGNVQDSITMYYQP